MGKSRTMTPEEFFKETFTPEFLERAAQEYQNAKIEGLQMALDESKKKIKELEGRLEYQTDLASRFNWVLKELGLYPDTEKERVLEEIRKLKHDKERAELYAQDLKVSIRNALTKQFAFLLKVADLQIVSTEESDQA